MRTLIFQRAHYNFIKNLIVFDCFKNPTLEYNLHLHFQTLDNMPF